MDGHYGFMVAETCRNVCYFPIISYYKTGIFSWGSVVLPFSTGILKNDSDLLAYVI
jgi:hypothetical protein